MSRSHIRGWAGSTQSNVSTSSSASLALADAATGKDLEVERVDFRKQADSEEPNRRYVSLEVNRRAPFEREVSVRALYELPRRFAYVVYASPVERLQVGMSGRRGRRVNQALALTLNTSQVFKPDTRQLPLKDQQVTVYRGRFQTNCKSRRP
jgi:hypothetical protein